VCIFPASKVNAKKKTWIKPKKRKELKKKKTKKKNCIFSTERRRKKKKRVLCVCVKGSTAKRVSLFL
jgi:tRNA A37 threonylcarbamoyladenosine dehydratase